MTTSVDTKPRAQRVDSQAETAPAPPVATRARADAAPAPAPPPVPPRARRGLATKRRVRAC